MTIQTNNIEILITSTAIQGRAVQAGHADLKVTELYMSAFVSAMLHSMEHNNHAILNYTLLQVPAKSVYRNRIIKWINEYLPVKYSDSKKTLILKVNDGIKAKWTEQGIQDAINNPFYAKQAPQEKGFECNKETLAIAKKLAKLIEKANDEGIDTSRLKTALSLLA